MRRHHGFLTLPLRYESPQTPIAEAGICGHQRYGTRKRTVITRCDISPSPFFSCRVSALYLLRFLVILDAGLSLLEGRRPRLVPPAFLFSRPSRRTSRIYRWASLQKLIATSQATYG